MTGIFDDFIKRCAEDCVNGSSGEMPTPQSVRPVQPACSTCAGRGKIHDGRDDRICPACFGDCVE